MSWYVIDAVDRAIERTRTCLFEPLDFMKWLKLAIIVLFIGGIGSFNSGGNGSSFDSSSGNADFSWVPNGFTDFMSDFAHNLSSYSEMALILGILAIIFVLVIILGYIGSVMEFVFVESLVSNNVRVRKYFKKYMGKGLSLYILRLVLMVLVLLTMAIVALPFIFVIGESGFDSGGALAIIGMIFGFITAVVLLVIVLGILGSFINMAIPVSMYPNSGILSALGGVFRQFRTDWKQVIIYWIGRAVLGLVVAIIAGILSLIILVILLLVLGLIDLAFYFILKAILPELLLWSLVVAVLVVQILLLIFVSAMISMPFSVFMKYHMLGFMEKWYNLKMPMFDEQQVFYAISTGQLSEGTIKSDE
ncbi:DUF7544 domain-containing protein [Methanolobus bombayensis]|uniref:DUF7544 domain-containing protein n=1 Tax=Methanolobus bombayensis TaxID=38023 RepID=UPI001AE7A336|nr:hypothetical protein [Methanolobus bombayensis]MBP1908426.1 hypothetical protein [Methanolobus bombayensis]